LEWTVLGWCLLYFAIWLLISLGETPGIEKIGWQVFLSTD